MTNSPNKNKIYMPNMTEFEEEYYKWEGKYELMDPDKFYENVENVQKKDPLDTPKNDNHYQ